MVGIRRSDMQIIQDILRMDRGGAAQLRLTANLSYAQLQKYLAFLEHLDLIALDRNSTRTITFMVTDKGQRVLELLDTLFAALGLNTDFDLEEHAVKSRRA